MQRFFWASRVIPESLTFEMERTSASSMPLVDRGTREQQLGYGALPDLVVGTDWLCTTERECVCWWHRWARSVQRQRSRWARGRCGLAVFSVLVVGAICGAGAYEELRRDTDAVRVDLPDLLQLCIHLAAAVSVLAAALCSRWAVDSPWCTLFSRRLELLGVELRGHEDAAVVINKREAGSVRAASALCAVAIVAMVMWFVFDMAWGYHFSDLLSSAWPAIVWVPFITVLIGVEGVGVCVALSQCERLHAYSQVMRQRLVLLLSANPDVDNSQCVRLLASYAQLVEQHNLTWGMLSGVLSFAHVLSIIQNVVDVFRLSSFQAFYALPLCTHAAIFTTLWLGAAQVSSGTTMLASALAREPGVAAPHLLQRVHSHRWQLRAAIGGVPVTYSLLVQLASTIGAGIYTVLRVELHTVSG